jgi:hypothetical protein
MTMAWLLDLDVRDAGYFVEVTDLEDHAARTWHFGDEDSPEETRRPSMRRTALRPCTSS